MSNNTFSAKTLKKLNNAKGMKDIVFRLRASYITIEFSDRDYITTSTECNAGFNITCQPNESRYDWVYIYASGIDTTWKFFIDSLRPSDEVIFMERYNTSGNLRDAGFKTVELRARVSRKNPQGKTIKQYETTIKSVTNKID